MKKVLSLISSLATVVVLHSVHADMDEWFSRKNNVYMGGLNVVVAGRIYELSISIVIRKVIAVYEDHSDYIFFRNSATFFLV